MRAAVIALFAACTTWAQFRTTVPLIVAPTTVTDAKGHRVEGLSASDLLLFDNNVPQPIQVDYDPYPISLVVAVQSAANAENILGKLDRIGIMLSQLIAAYGGETALLSFDNSVQLRQDFTTDSDKLTNTLKKLRSGGDGASALDAISEALRMLGTRKPERRRIILMVAEKRDRSSNAKLVDVIEQVQRQNATIYWLTFSPFLTTYTNRQYSAHGTPKEGPPEPRETPPMDLLAPFIELAHLSAPNISQLLPQATGGKALNFLTRGALESEIQAIGEDVHGQYIVTFQPKAADPGQFHAIRVEIRDRPELVAKTRAGYWSVQ